MENIPVVDGVTTIETSIPNPPIRFKIQNSSYGSTFTVNEVKIYGDGDSAPKPVTFGEITLTPAAAYLEGQTANNPVTEFGSQYSTIKKIKIDVTGANGAEGPAIPLAILTSAIAAAFALCMRKKDE